MPQDSISSCDESSYTDFLAPDNDKHWNLQVFMSDTLCYAAAGSYPVGDLSGPNPDVIDIQISSIYQGTAINLASKAGGTVSLSFVNGKQTVTGNNLSAEETWFNPNTNMVETTNRMVSFQLTLEP